MTTWGPSKKQTAKSRRTESARGSAGRSTPPSSTGSRNGSSGRAGGSYRQGRSGGGRATAAETPPTGVRQQSGAELRTAVEDRQTELIGIGLIAAGVLLALAVYLNLAGPLGSGIESLFGWIFGIGRYVVPIVLVAAGVALVKKGHSSSPVRLAIGWGLVGVAALGVVHVINGPDRIGDADNLGHSGGVVGAVVGVPMQSLLAPAGAVVLFLAAGLGGALLVTQTSLRTMAEKTGAGVGSVARPLGRAARQALRDLSTLSSDKTGTDDGAQDGTLVMGEPRPLPPPSVYDAADDFADPPGRRARAKVPPAPVDVVPAGTTTNGAWTLPPVSFLHRTGAQTINRAEVEARGRVLQESLQQHGVDTSLVGMTVGPTVTRYELELGPGVKVARVTSLQRDIAYAMAATDVRILAPIPGRSAIGVEVPNHTRQLVALGDLLVSPEAAAATGPLEVAIGKDIAGKSVFLDLATTPHLLIAGATGAGKSSGINCIITSLLMRTTPDQVRLILVDPKQVEMGQYNRLPHLLTQPVTNPKKAANALGWAVKEMERRYDVLFEVGFRDIGGYNASFDRGELGPKDQGTLDDAEPTGAPRPTRRTSASRTSSSSSTS